ncbi:PGPGW domain-containing protein [Kutzneria sp. 744]
MAIAGFAVLALGIVLIPYPGPGWLVFFAGLAILATEFTWSTLEATFHK